MTFDLGSNAFWGLIVVCGTALAWRWLTITIVKETAPEEVHIYRPNEEEEDRYGRD